MGNSGARRHGVGLAILLAAGSVGALENNSAPLIDFGEMMFRNIKLAAALYIFVSSSCFADCAHEGLAVAALVDARDSGVTYAKAKQFLRDKKDAIGKVRYSQILRYQKIAYENIPANVSAVESSQIVFDTCKKVDGSPKPSDLCLAIGYGVGLMALERDKGKTKEKLIYEARDKDSVTKNVTENVVSLVFANRNLSPFELETQQFQKCRQIQTKSQSKGQGSN